MWTIFIVFLSTTMKSSPCSPQLEKAWAQQWKNPVQPKIKINKLSFKKILGKSRGTGSGNISQSWVYHDNGNSKYKEPKVGFTDACFPDVASVRTPPHWETGSISPRFLGGSVSKESACNMEDLGSVPGLERSPGGRHGNPLQYSCLENPHGQRSLAGYSP